METFQEIRKLYDIFDNSFGIPEAEIIESEFRLGRRLPKVLRDYYLQFGNNKQMNQTQDSLILPSKIKIYEDKFGFYQENQGNWLALIDLKDSYEDNPPVYYDYDEAERVVNLFEFLTGIAFLQSIFVFPFNGHSAGAESKTVKVIKEHWTLVRKFNAPSFEVEFLQNSSDEIICLRSYDGFDEPELSIAAKSQELYAEILDKINIVWEFGSLIDD